MAAADGNPLDQTRSPAAESKGDYMVVARRYRPQTFEELIGQEHVARALRGAIAANRVGHAYLFTGARGVGKTSAARILAKALDCEHGPAATPCNRCEMCTSISAGSDVDVLEIDGASNRGIDEIRQLRQNVNVRPSRARFKIYIIDEVHMLTREAFNALLKTLEEPPEHVKFIFCTTEATKIPITILSRCQRFDFAGIQLPSIVERLQQIVTAEGVTAEPEVLAILARRAAGSMRDSQSLLEQLLAVGGPRITADDVHTMLGTAGEARLSELVAHLVEHNAAAALANLDAALMEGVDVGQLLEQLLGYFRDVMVAAVGCSADALLHASSSQHDALAAAGREIGLATTLAIMQIIEQTLARLRYSTQGRTLAEMALVRISGLENLEQLSDLIAELRSGGAPAIPGATPTAAPTPRPGSPSVVAAKKKDDSPIGTANGHSAGNASTAYSNGGRPSAATHDASPDVSAAQPPVAKIELTNESAQTVWQAALERLSTMLAEYAARAESLSISPQGRLVAVFRAKYTSFKTYCERPEQLSKLQEALADVTGQPVKVEFTIAPDEPSPEAERQVVPQRQRLAAKSEHPMIRRATELFDARLVRIEEPGE